MLGLIGAMKIEMEQLLSNLGDARTTQIGSMTFHAGSLWGRRAVLCVCGPGKVNAALCAQAMILTYHPEAVINLGVAGSLSGELSIGDVVVGTYAVEHDMDTTPLGDPPGYLSGIGLVRLPLDEPLRARLLKTLQSLPDMHGAAGGIATGDQFLHDHAGRDRVRELFGCLCCEMEGAAVAHACYMNDVPCAVIRSISDNADGTSDTDFLRFASSAAENAARLIRLFLTQGEERPE